MIPEISLLYFSLFSVTSVVKSLRDRL